MGGKPKTSTPADMRLKQNKQKAAAKQSAVSNETQRSLKKGTMTYGNK